MADRKNTLAYYTYVLITVEKSFMTYGAVVGATTFSMLTLRRTLTQRCLLIVTLAVNILNAVTLSVIY